MLTLDLLQKAHYQLEVAHCNFQLRGKESDNDADFVKVHCRKNKIVFHEKRFDLSGEKGSTQMRARSLRFEWFEQLRKDRGLDFIVLGSHLDDRFETALINLLRGTGPAGIRNMQAVSAKIIRPMLGFEKKEIIKEIHNSAVPFREDSSNLKTDYLRNYLRIEIIPKLKELNPSLLKTYERSARIMAQHETLSHESCESFLQGHLIHDKLFIALKKSDLMNFSAPLLLLSYWLKPLGFNQEQLEELLGGIDGNETRAFESKGYKLSADREMISVYKHGLDKQKEEFAEGTPFHSPSYALTLDKATLPVDLRSEQVDFVDLNKLSFPVMLRSWKEGDRMHPLGMKGSKKLSDIFTDKKLSAIQKSKLCVLVSEDKVVCVPGLVISEDHKVDENTTDVLAIKRDPAAS